MGRRPGKPAASSAPLPIVSVAPMVDVTDRHFRSLIRIMTKRTLLYTPMYLARRVALRKRYEVSQMLLFRPAELPLAVQLGGDDVRHIMGAARKCQDAGFSEINLNLGCPAGTAQERNFGATLMKPPHDKITKLVKTMTSQLDVPVSVKVRIGVDSYDDYPFFRNFIEQLHVHGGCNRFVVHARKALLDGISTRQNRLDELVPLRHDWVYRLKQEMPQLHMEINGGIKSVHDMQTHLAHPCGLNGVMMGRLARDNPFVFTEIDSSLFGDRNVWKHLSPIDGRMEVLRQYAEYALAEQDLGVESRREMLMRPTNQLFEGFPLEKRVFATLLRGTPKERRAPMFGQELLQVLDRLPGEVEAERKKLRLAHQPRQKPPPKGLGTLKSHAGKPIVPARVTRKPGQTAADSSKATPTHKKSTGGGQRPRRSRAQ